jgi:ATP-binding cassette subfamily F protein 3
MAVLKVSGFSKSFGINTVFDQVSFEIRSGERIGLVGANGAGKSTLLKCMTGREEADKGSVKSSAGTSIGYLRQDFNYNHDTLRGEMEEAWEDVLSCQRHLGELTQAMAEQKGNAEALVEEYGKTEERFSLLGGYEYEAMTRKILSGLGFSDTDWDRSIQSFSGGQKVRINLASALVRQPDFLLLDEPTNHLDMEMLEWLEEYLKSYRGGLLTVSHDRYFLDEVSTGILFLEQTRMRSFRGNYTHFIQVREEQDSAQRTAYKKQQEHIADTEEYIRRYKAGIKSKQARGRQSQLNRLQRMAPPVQEDTLHFQFEITDQSAERVLDIKNAAASYGEHCIFKNLSAQIRRGQTVGMIGPNGAGKTTLLKLITGDKKPDEGFIRIGDQVRVGYYSQEQERLNPRLTVIEQITETFGYGEKEARNILGRFLFRGDDVFRSVTLLSGGEKARLSLLCLFLQKPNFLILDEPTNHLDIPTREMMENALASFSGTCLIVSHDRYFLDKVATVIWEMSGGVLNEFLGNYTYFREKQRDLERFEADQREAAQMGQSERQKEIIHQQEPAEKHEKIQKDALPGDKIEMEISRMEATLKMYESKMNEESPDNPEMLAELSRMYEETKKELDHLYARWEKAAAES